MGSSISRNLFTTTASMDAPSPDVTLVATPDPRSPTCSFKRSPVLSALRFDPREPTAHRSPALAIRMAERAQDPRSPMSAYARSPYRTQVAVSPETGRPPVRRPLFGAGSDDHVLRALESDMDAQSLAQDGKATVHQAPVMPKPKQTFVETLTPRKATSETSTPSKDFASDAPMGSPVVMLLKSVTNSPIVQRMLNSPQARRVTHRMRSIMRLETAHNSPTRLDMQAA